MGGNNSIVDIALRKHINFTAARTVAMFYNARVCTQACANGVQYGHPGRQRARGSARTEVPPYVSSHPKPESISIVRRHNGKGRSQCSSLLGNHKNRPTSHKSTVN